MFLKVIEMRTGKLLKMNWKKNDCKVAEMNHFYLSKYAHDKEKN